MSWNQLTAALVSSRLELAPALANLNFDFSLCKIEAPLEFQGVGKALTKSRREDAEVGRLHVLARKLGALFEPDLPDTPALFKAYGQRSSEIASSSTVDPKTLAQYGAFAGQAGVDGTSLWAAATSGRGAISVHLLACLLARIWSGPEATSIWVEIINYKKQEVISKIEKGDMVDISSVFAARQDIDRKHIREWDASARAWLQAADNTMMKRQKQLMLIIDHLGQPVNQRPDTFDSVMEAWKGSLQQMEMLIKGVAIPAAQGDILLALASWHLYPDLTVLKPEVKDILQKDPLVPPGGILTIGMEPADHDIQSEDGSRSGIYWSLPLTYLRHYGAPAIVRKNLEISKSRVTLEEFMFAVLGCFLKKWENASNDFNRTIDWLSRLSSTLEKLEKSADEWPLGVEEQQPLLLHILTSAAKRYQTLKGTERVLASKLLLIGQRHGENFIKGDPKELFGLIEHCAFITLLKTEEQKITMLRKIARCVGAWYSNETLKDQDNALIIRYSHHGLNELTSALVHGTCRKCNPSGSSEPYYYSFPLTRAGLEVSSSYTEELGSTAFELSSRNCSMAFSAKYHFLCGDSNDVALYHRSDIKPPTDVFRLKELYTDILYSCDLDGEIEPRRLSSFLHSYFTQFHEHHGHYSLSMRAITTACYLYSSLPQSLIDLRVLRHNQYLAKWNNDKPRISALTPFPLSHEAAFSCILMFETGIYDVDPKIIGGVIALSTGYSIFVRGDLLCDPSKPYLGDRIRCIEGNVGHPGVSILVPPPHPMMRSVDLADWQQMSGLETSYSSADSFADTTLHLAFTGTQEAVNIGFSGGQDVEVSMLETLVRVYDGGEWVADLDVCKFLDNGSFFVSHSSCSQPSSHSPERELQHVSINGWVGLIDASPDHVNVVHAHGNWQARLAAAALSLRLGYNTYILGGKLCWDCIIEYKTAHEHRTAKKRRTAHKHRTAHLDCGSSTFVVIA